MANTVIKWSLMFIFIVLLITHITFFLLQSYESFNTETVGVAVDISNDTDYISIITDNLLPSDANYKDFFFQKFQKFIINDLLPGSGEGKQIVDASKDKSFMLLKLNDAQVVCDTLRAPFIVQAFKVKLVSRDDIIPDDACVLQFYVGKTDSTRMITRDNLITFLNLLNPSWLKQQYDASVASNIEKDKRNTMITNQLTATQTSLNNANTTINSLQSMQNNMMNQLSTSNNTISTLRSQIQTLQSQNSTLTSSQSQQLTQLQSQLQTTINQNQQLQTTINSLNQEMNRLRTQTSSQTTSNGAQTVATFFQDCDFSGWSVSLPPGDYDIHAMQARGILNDHISSVKVTPGWKVTLYEHGLGSRSFETTSDVRCLVNNGFNDITSHITITQASSTNSSITLSTNNVSYNGNIAEFVNSSQMPYMNNNLDGLNKFIAKCWSFGTYSGRKLSPAWAILHPIKNPPQPGGNLWETAWWCYSHSSFSKDLLVIEFDVARTVSSITFRNPNGQTYANIKTSTVNVYSIDSVNGNTITGATFLASLDLTLAGAVDILGTIPINRTLKHLLFTRTGGGMWSRIGAIVIN